MRIVYTGSSMLEIDNAKVDMSRRQTPYTLKGMSFREYLEYEGILKTEAVPLETLLSSHISIAMDIVPKTKVQKQFEAYLHHGVYPFYKEAGTDSLVRLKEVVNTVIESDLPAVEKVTYETLEKCKKLFMIIAEKVPLQPNIERLAASLGTTRDTLLNILYSLDKSEVLEFLFKIGILDSIILNKINRPFQQIFESKLEIEIILAIYQQREGVTVKNNSKIHIAVFVELIGKD